MRTPDELRLFQFVASGEDTRDVERIIDIFRKQDHACICSLRRTLVVEEKLRILHFDFALSEERHRSIDVSKNQLW